MPGKIERRRSLDTPASKWPMHHVEWVSFRACVAPAIRVLRLVSQPLAKHRSFNAVVQQVLLRRTGRP